MKKLINISLSEIKLNDLTKLKNETLILGSYESKKLSALTEVFDKKSKGVLKKLISREALSGSLGNKVYLPNLVGIDSEKVYFIGCGKENKEINEQEFLAFSQSIANAAIQSKAKNVHIFIPNILVKNRSEEWNYKILARTLESNCYKYFFKGKKNQPKNTLSKVIILKTAEEKKIPFQRLASSRYTGTDTDAFAYSNGGVPSALISLPLRYMHTTVEMVHKEDVENVIRLIYESLLFINPKKGFSYFD